MSFLGNLVGRAEHTIQNVEHAAGNAINNAVHGGQAAPASTGKPIGDPIAPQLQQQIQQARQLQPLPQAQMMPMLNAQGQPQYNPSMGGAPVPGMNQNQLPIVRGIIGLAQQTPYGPNATDSHTMDAIQQSTGFPSQNLQDILNR